MSLESYLEKYSESKNIFQDQLFLILHLKSVVIRPSKFPNGLALESILEGLEVLMLSLEPRTYIEQLHFIEWNFLSLPSESAFLFGPQLKVLNLHNNQLNAIPGYLATCHNLENLDLSLNSIKTIRRKDLYSLVSLKTLLLKDNKLSFLPPVLADLASLESIDYSENPLIFPSVEFTESTSNTLRDLKSYLTNNRQLIDQHLDSQVQLNLKQSGPTTPSFVRTRSMSDARTKSLKASRRMGLFINNSKATPEESSNVPIQSMDSLTPSKPDRKMSFQSSEAISSQETTKEKDVRLRADTSKLQIPITHHKQLESHSSNKEVEKSRVFSSAEDLILDQVDYIDPDPKLNTFSRRLSTLQERPLDEHSRSHLQEKKPDFPKAEDTKTTPHKANGFDVSPSKLSKSFTNGNNNSPLQWPHTYSTMMQIVRKLLFCCREVKTSLARLFPDNRIPGGLINIMLSFSRDYTFLQEKADTQEASEENAQILFKALVSTIGSFKGSLASCNEHAKSLSNKADICQLRATYMSLFGTLNELNNIHRLVLSIFNSPKTFQLNGKGSILVSPSQVDQKVKASQQIHSREQSSESAVSDVISGDIDVRLLKAVDYSTSDALIVLGELTDTISSQVLTNLKAPQLYSSALVLKCKDLNTVCNSAGDITRRLIASLHSYRAQPTPPVRKSLWDDINSFLKVILQIFATVKGIMNDGPILNDVRQSMANLTKSTKEVTILLEVSSLKSSNEITTSALSSNLTLLGGYLGPQIQLQGSLSNVSSQQLLANVKASIRGLQLTTSNPSSTTNLSSQDTFRTNVNALNPASANHSPEDLVASQGANILSDP